MAGWQNEVLVALALIGADDSQVRQNPLPVVEDHASHEPGRNLDDHRPALLKIDERGDVGCRVVRRENSEFLREVQIGQHLAALRLEDVEMRPPPFVEAHCGDTPQIRLGRPLKIHLVVKLPDRRLGRIAALEGEFADAGILDLLGRGGPEASGNFIGLRSDSGRLSG